jgi:putative hydrolase of the HAD superfamily
VPATAAIVLDIGGVLLVPDPDLLGRALDRVEVAYDPAALPMAHYDGVAALDAAPTAWAGAYAPSPYLDGLLRGAAVAEDDLPRARPAAAEALGGSSLEVWCHETPWARDGMAHLEATGVPVGVVSNADGTVEQQLRLHGFAQVGEGPGLDVVAIVDSTVVGVAKPDPAVFAPVLTALELPPERCAYIGDTVLFDVEGARAAGLRPVHLDPLASCQLDDHLHATTLTAAVDVALDG